MKKHLIFVALMMLSLCLSAQRPHLQLGVHAGLNARAYGIKVLALFIVVTDSTVSETDTIITLKGTDGGFQIGFLFRISKARKYAETGINFVRTSVPVFSTEIDSAASDAKTVYGVEIPFLVGYKVVSTPLFKWRLSTGLNLGIIGKVKANDQGFSRSDFTNPRVGLRAGTGIDLAMMYLDFYYTLGLTKEFKSLDIRTQSHLVQLNIGVLF